MAQTQFAKTGFLARIAPKATITRFHVLGERSSGTNFTKRLLGRNTDLTPTEALGWKHGFPHALAVPPDLLVIAMVRRADDWARSMHTKPWHCSPEMQAMGFSDFLRAQWDTYVDRPRYFDGAARLGILGQPLQHDRHPITGKRFANMFALREAKLAGLFSYMERDCNFILLRMEETTKTPETVLDAILKAIDRPANDAEFRPVFKRLGAKFKTAEGIEHPETPPEISPEDHAFLSGAVNTAQEKALGYVYKN